MYFMSDILYVLFYYILKYRYKVVRTNYENAFPEKSSAQIKTEIKQFYHYLCDLTLETIKGLTADDDEIIRRCKITNPDLLNHYFEQNKSILVLASHYCNYEWGTRIGKQLKHRVMGIYKPLKNPLIDQYLREGRTQDTVIIVPMKSTFKAIEQYSDQPLCAVLIADQSPRDKDTAFWFPFLNQDTPFLRGPNDISRHFDTPVFYADEQRVSRGYYTITFSLLCENPKEVGEGEMIRMYKDRLEKAIRQKPAFWLWSHKRWKHQRPETTDKSSTTYL